MIKISKPIIEFIDGEGKTKEELLELARERNKPKVDDSDE